MEKHYLLTVFGDVEPVLSEPMQHYGMVLEAARGHRDNEGDSDGLFSLVIDNNGELIVESFSSLELDGSEDGSINVTVVAVHPHIEVEYEAKGLLLPDGSFRALTEFRLKGDIAKLPNDWLYSHVLTDSGTRFDVDRATLTVTGYTI